MKEVSIYRDISVLGREKELSLEAFIVRKMERFGSI
jgi:hypothetical protein